MLVQAQAPAAADPFAAINDLLADRNGDGVPDILDAAFRNVPGAVAQRSTQVVTRSTHQEVLVQVTHPDGRIETRRQTTTRASDPPPPTIGSFGQPPTTMVVQIASQPKPGSVGPVIAIVLLSVLLGVGGVILLVLLL